MKRCIFLIIFFIILWKPSPTGKGQNRTDSASIIYRLKAEQKQLFETAFANQDTLKQLAKKKPAIIIVEKTKYVKVYKTVPIYVPQIDSSAYKKAFPLDTLENDYYIQPPFGSPPKGIKKRTWLYKLFHKK